MLSTFIQKLKNTPESVSFDETIDVIDNTYHFTPTAFLNGTTSNEANQNNGSCKIFAFAKLNGLDVNETLHCFGDYYRKDVLEHPENDDHQNIRNFITNGWDGVRFEGEALSPKTS